MKRILLIALFSLFSLSLSAQKTTQNLACWMGFEMYLPFKEHGKWGLLLESYIKGNKGIGQLQGSFYRAGLNYYTKKGNRIGAGYAYQWNLPYDSVALPYANADNRIYEQFLWRIVRKNGDVVWTQRFRMEQRWLGRKDEEDGFYYKFENTFRYQLKYQYWFKPKWAIVLYEEVHLRTTAMLDNENFLDQNRAYIGGAYDLSNKREIRLELGYMHQSFWNSVETPIAKNRVNHTIRVTLTTDLPMSR